MVKSVTSLTRNGLRDWIVQRVSAVLIAIYVIFLVIYFLTHPGLEYAQWQTLFTCNAMRVFSLVVVISLILHTWVGMWTIGTDYLKPLAVRLIYDVIVAVALLAFFIWAIQILWGV